MYGMFMGGLQTPQSQASTSTASQAANTAQQARSDIRELKDQVERLSLLNQALWELVRERIGVTDRDLEKLAQQIDLRDGRADGKMSAVALTCPTCQRVVNSKHDRCMYCGTLFEKPLFG